MTWQMHYNYSKLLVIYDFLWHNNALIFYVHYIYLGIFNAGIQLCAK